MEKLYGKWNNETAFLNDGLSGGPLLLFNTNGSTIIISSMSNFMSASIKHDKLIKGTLDYGIMSGVDTIPSNFSVDFMMFYSDDGIKLVSTCFYNCIRISIST